MGAFGARRFLLGNEGPIAGWGGAVVLLQPGPLGGSLGGEAGALGGPVRAESGFAARLLEQGASELQSGEEL